MITFPYAFSPTVRNRGITRKTFVGNSYVLELMIGCLHDAQNYFVKYCQFFPLVCCLETPCEGYTINERVQGDDTDEMLRNLRDRFCGCQYVTGFISFSFREENRVLTVDDFNMFYYLKEIYDALIIRDVRASRIIFPNLRIIRGRELLSLGNREAALRLDSLNVSEFILPKLTEITRGGMYIMRGSGSCLLNVLRVQWNDIIDKSNGGFFDDGECRNNVEQDGMLTST